MIFPLFMFRADEAHVAQAWLLVRTPEKLEILASWALALEIPVSGAGGGLYLLKSPFPYAAPG